MSAFQVCRVGYALNPKKLRKAKPVDDGPENAEPEDASRATVVSAEKTPWCGGGLATIVGLDQQAEGAAGEAEGEVEVDGVVFAPLADGGEFHVILHKLTEDLDLDPDPEPCTYLSPSPSPSPDSRSEKLRDLQQYLSKHPHTAVVDPVENVRTVVNRATTCAVLQKVQQRLRGACPFAQPAFAVLDGPRQGQVSDSESILATMRAHGLSFPVICKPLKACGTPESHNMTVVLSPAGLAGVSRPCLMQQFRDHGSVFYKVYVLDGEVLTAPRRSLPNFEESMSALLAAGVHCTAFDSRVPFPGLPLPLPLPPQRLDLERDAEGCKESKDNKDSSMEGPAAVGEEVDAALRARIARAAQEISLEFGLSLYGFDVIVPLARAKDTGAGTGTGDEAEAGRSEALVIDVNFFPSYKNVPDFPAKLRAYLRRAAQLEPWRGA